MARIHFVLTVLILLAIIGQGCTPINPHDRSTLDHSKPELSPVLTEEQVLTDDEMEDLKYALDLAEYYYALGVNFNREGEWLEAQRNFEKSLEILSSIDVSADSNGTNQRFETLLEEIEQDYRFTLTSLGLLSDESSHGAFLELFSDIKNFKKLRETLPFRQVEKPESVTYDMPIEINERVENSLVYLQTVGRQHFEVYLARMGKYKDLMLEIIREHGLPEDLVYLPLIESGYNPSAYSYARAMGPWQFISSTGRLYGLKRNWWYDERRDFVKSTHAACRYLKFLYEKFGCWKLALAAYNGGEGRVSRTIKRQKTDDFWRLRLKHQTRNYVPLYMAATMIAKDPDKYGYGHVQQMEPLRFDVVAVDKVVELKKVASALGVNLQSIKELNPELMRGVTPPSHGNYQLRIPAGFSDKFNEVYASIPKEKYTDWVVHRVRRGEALSTIAQAYGVRLSSLKSANRIGRSNRIYAGQKLIIPVPQGYKKRNVSPETVNSKPANTAPPRTENGVYTVKRGDNLWDISRKFNTDVDDIKDTNNLRGRNPRLYPGDKLVIPGSEKEGDEESVYVVKQGDSLWSIAKKFNTTVSAIRKWNNLPLMKLIMPGDRLIVSPPG